MIVKRKKRRGLVLFQLFIVAAFLVALWFSFGQNVLAPAKQGVPERLGTLELVGSIEGPEALAQINRLHGTDIELVSAYIVKYAHGNERATVWAGKTASSHARAELTERMLQAIEKGGSGFSNLQRLSIADHEVLQVDGPGGKHFFYNSSKRGEEVVWLTIDAADTLPIVKEALKTF